MLKENKLTETCCGTSNYIASEVLFNEKYGKDAIIGVLEFWIFCLLTGELPFNYENTNVIYQKIRDC